MGNQTLRISRRCAWSKCRKTFGTKPSLKHVRYCSYDCCWAARRWAYRGKRNPYFGKTHSVEVTAKMRGPNHHNWQGGRFRHPEGYVYVLRREHPRANRGGYVYEHILVAEGMTGRTLTKGEVVHHINGVKHDNRPENLLVFKTNQEHLAHHRARPQP